MEEFILNLLDRKDASALSENEEILLEKGIEVFCASNGITKNNAYFRQYVQRIFEKIDNRDLKNYLINYELICKVRHITAKYMAGRPITKLQKQELYDAVVNLRKAGLGSKYIPQMEISQIFSGEKGQKDDVRDDSYK